MIYIFIGEEIILSAQRLTPVNFAANAKESILRKILMSSMLEAMALSVRNVPLFQPR
jgi:hypothetical protein